MSVTVHAVLVGRVAPLGPGGPPSGIAKSLVAELIVGSGGILGDEQADRRHHGGPDKAVHHYAFEHYPAWRSAFAVPPGCLAGPGAFGENLSTTGMVEDDVCVGDVWRFGTALLEVSQARQPCWKLDWRLGRRGAARMVQETGRTGWYYRVVEAGRCAAGDAVELVERPLPDWPLRRLLRALYVDIMDRPTLTAMAALGVLAESWRRVARRRLETGQVEDWGRRLDGPADLPGFLQTVNSDPTKA